MEKIDLVVNNGNYEMILETEGDIEERKASLAKRLNGYYEFLNKNIDTCGDENKEKILKRIPASLSTEGIEEIAHRLESEQGREELIQAANNLIEAYSEDNDIDDFDDEVINGNRFSFSKELNIEPFREELHAIGNEVKGRKWRVELEDGKVVLFE